MFVLLFINFNPRVLSRKLRTRAQPSHGNITVLSLLNLNYLIYFIYLFDLIYLVYSLPNSWVARDVIIFENPKLESHQSYYLHQA